MQNDCFPDSLADWEKVPVIALAEQNPRYPVKKGVEYPFVEMASVAENFGGISKLDSRQMAGSGLARFKVNDTLFAKITPCPENGKVAFVSSLPTDIGLGSTEFIVLSPRNETDPRFLYHLVCSYAVRGRATARMEGSTGRQRVPGDVFERRLFVPKPSKDEQAAIARVLDAVDTAIERTHIAIEKAQATRLALMQAAFHYEMTSESKYDTEAGRIPQSWEALKGRQAFTILTGGNSSVQALKPLRGEDIADAWFMKVDDFNLPVNLRKIVTTQIGFVADKNPSFKLLPLGTIIIAKRGAAILKNRVRISAVPIALDPNLMALTVRDDILPDFFRYQLEWRNLTRYIESSGVPQLNNKDLYPRWFVRAPEEQQQEIVTIISTAEQHEDALHNKLAALEQLKRSLMHDLLTGTVRIAPKLIKELSEL